MRKKESIRHLSLLFSLMIIGVLVLIVFISVSNHKVKEKNLPGELGTSGVFSSGASGGLVAYYPFDGNASDASGNGNNGVVNGTILTKGIIGQAYSFNGIDNSISIPGNSNLQPNKISISVWINKRSNNSGTLNSWKAFVATDRGMNDSNSYWLGLAYNSDQARFYLDDGTGVFGPFIDSPFNLNNNIWYNVVGTFDGLVMRLYINGVEVSSKRIPNGINYNGIRPVSVGADYNGKSYASSDFFNGTIDEVKIWNYALNKTEIGDEYNKYKQLVSYYPLNGNASDVSGGNNGYIGGGDNFDSGISSSFWTVSSDASASSGMVYINHPANSATRGITSKFNLSGDFDVYLQYSGLNLPSCIYSAIGMNLSGATSTSFNIERRQNSGTNTIATDFITYTNTPDTSSSGTFRLKRVGSTAYVYMSDAGTILKSGIVGTGNVTITLYGRDDTNGCIAQGYFDNLLVYSNGVGVNLPTPIIGKIGQAYLFNGINNFIFGNFTPSNFNTLSISAWFKGSNGTIFAIGYMNDSGYLFPRTGIGLWNNQFTTRIIDDSLVTNELYSPDNSNDGAWHFGTLTYDGTIAKIYVDGVLKNSTILSNAQAYSNYFKIGLGTGGHWSYFNGSIDEVKLWNYPLSATEIIDEYDRGITCSVKTDCWADGWTGDSVCEYRDVYQNYTTYSCNSGVCSSSTTLQLNKTCPSEMGCLNGVCTTGGPCPTPDDTIIKLSSGTNAHAAIWNDTDYQYSICYSNIFGRNYSGANPHDCLLSNINKIVGLSDETNAHLEIPSWNRYGVNVCYGDLSCENVSGVINSGLTANYHFEGNLIDTSGNANDGNANDVVSTNGKIGQAYKFNGADSYININNTLVNSNSFTISAWANISGRGFGNQNPIFEQRDDVSGSNRVMIILFANAGDGVAFDVRSSNGNLNELTFPKKNNNEWHHYAGVVNSTSILLYIDGVLVNSTGNNQLGDYNTSISYTDIGRNRNSGSNAGFLNGTIDEVKIWDKALSSSDISNEYLGNLSECNDNEKLVISLSSYSNAHASSKSDSIYSTNICCKSSVECINDSQCNGTINKCNSLGHCVECTGLGDCTGGLICNAGKCVSPCIDTCANLGYQCGHHLICGNDTDCNNCQAGYSCDTSGHCILDNSPPVISSISVSGIESSRGYVNWNTNENANGTINYGLSSSNLSMIQVDTSMVTNHSIGLFNLASSTTYYFTVTSCDEARNCATIGGNNFVTSNSDSSGSTGSTGSSGGTVKLKNQTNVQVSFEDRTVDIGEIIEYAISASGLNLSKKIIYSASGLPTDALFDSATGKFSWKPQNAGQYIVNFSVSDGKLTIIKLLRITVNEPVTAPNETPIEPLPTPVTTKSYGTFIFWEIVIILIVAIVIVGILIAVFIGRKGSKGASRQYNTKYGRSRI